MESSSSSPVPGNVDILIHSRWLLPMTASGKVLERHAVAIRDNRIVDIGPGTDLSARYRATREFHLDNHVVLPGLINGHGHAPMSLLRGFADDLALHPWLEQKIWPAEARWVNEAFVADGARLAIAEMLLGGTTCFTDMYYFPDQVAKVAIEAGIRVQLACPVLDFATVWAADSDEYIHKATRLHDEYRNNDLVRVVFGPHAPYTVSDAPLRKAAMLADELDLALHMHVHENAQEIAEARAATGLRPLKRLEQLDLLNPRLQCVHMTQLQDDEITLLATHDVQVIHCPASNLKLASGACRVSDLLNAGVTVALGTDSCASNNNLDMFSELRLAALLEKGRRNDAAALPAYQALQMATTHGARIIGMEDQLGTLEAGKLADMIAVDLDHPATQPVYDPVSTVVYSASARQVSHVWINGQLLVEAGQLTRLDQQQITLQAQQWGTKIGESFNV